MIRLPRWPHAHREPLRWLLFGAGGVLGALLLPAIALVVGVLGPIGAVDLTSIGPAAVGGWGLAMRLAVHALVALLLFHAGHRIHHGLHDLKLPRGWASRAVCYGPGWAWFAVVALDVAGALRWLVPFG
jgi:fumarate reductase subunit D